MLTHRTNGFTIIELSLAMTFVSVLLLAIAMTAIQAGRTYNKGVILESVNQAGRDIGDTLRRDFMGADARQVQEDSANGPVFLLRDGGDVRSGRLCLGSYTYLWNTPGTLKASLDGLSLTGPVVKQNAQVANVIRVADVGGSLCVNSYSETELDGKHSVSLLDEKGSKGVVLAIHSFEVTPVVRRADNSEALYLIRYTIGTSELSEITGQQCRPPVDASSNEQFCAINKFEMIVRTNG